MPPRKRPADPTPVVLVPVGATVPAGCRECRSRACNAVPAAVCRHTNRRRPMPAILRGRRPLPIRTSVKETI